MCFCAVLKEGDGLVIANFVHGRLNILVELVHQFLVLFVDLVGNPQLVLHGLQGRLVLRRVAKGFDGRLSPFVQGPVGISFQVYYLQRKGFLVDLSLLAPA